MMPDRPWQKVAVDSCELKGRHFQVVVEIFSKFIENSLPRRIGKRNSYWENEKHINNGGSLRNLCQIA